MEGEGKPGSRNEPDRVSGGKRSVESGQVRQGGDTATVGDSIRFELLGRQLRISNT